MNRFTQPFLPAIAVALTLVLSFISFTEARADDFQSLINEINFSKQTASSQGLAVADRQTAPALRRVPSGYEMPSGFDMPTGYDQAATKLQAPVATRSLGSQSEAMSAASAVGQMQANSGSVKADSVGHLLGRRHGADCGCDTCDTCDALPAPKKPFRLPKLGCKSGCASGCGEIIDARCGCDCGCGSKRGCRLKRKKQVEQKVCMPRRDVNLPSSTLQQYFRSDRCYTNVWDGYSRECGKNHEHIHGTCDCGTKKKRSCLSGHCRGGCGEILPPRQACNDCESCDACDSGYCR